MDNSLLENLQRAVSLNPQFAEGHLAIANVFRAQKNFNAALSSYQKAIDANPRIESSYLAIVEILLSLKKLEEAVASVKEALAANLNSSSLYLNLGRLLMERDIAVEAIICLERAVLHDSNCVEAYGRLGLLLGKQGRTVEGITALQRAVALKPQDSHLSYYLAQAFHRAGKLVEAIGCLRKSIELNPNNIEVQTDLLATLLYSPDYTKEQSVADRTAFGERMEAPWRKKWPKYKKPIDLHKRLRVGFVSGDLYSHPVGYFLESVLRELRNLDVLDIIVYSTNPVVDAVTDRIRDTVHTWIPAYSLSDDAFEKEIRDEGIDILVDLSGHTPGNRLMVFACKPAPIQVTWLGYWETTGLRSIDYILCDRNSVRDDDANYFVEKPWYLPNTRLCFTVPDEPVVVAPPPALNNGFITFGCFNNVLKMTDRVVAVWSRIILRVPNSRLLLKWPSFYDLSICEDVKARFIKEGVSADRLELQQASPLQEYLSTYHRIDIALDPFPFPGGTTSVQGIWMGVPMITLRGDRMIYRQGESVLHNIGLHDWIAKDEDEYIELAVQKAGDLTGLAELRRELRGKLESSPLCDAKSFARNLENAFRQMWDKYCCEC